MKLNHVVEKWRGVSTLGFEDRSVFEVLKSAIRLLSEQRTGDLGTSTDRIEPNQGGLLQT
ncbi:MAG: hypothetical protein ACE361_08105 [Aureliella sp.]